MNLPRAALFASAFFWTLLITALVGNAIAISNGGSPSAINYGMFAAVFSWLVLIFGVLTVFTFESLSGFSAIAEAVAAAVTFIAAVVFSAKLGVHSCGNHHYVASNSLTRGTDHQSRRCHELQASTAFFWFLFATYVASALIAFLSGGSGLASRGGIRKGGPSMSQV